MKCDVEHQLISFSGKECPLCKVRDVLYELEQVFAELEEKRPSLKKTKAAPKKKAKVLQFVRKEVSAVANNIFA